MKKVIIFLLAVLSAQALSGQSNYLEEFRQKIRDSWQYRRTLVYDRYGDSRIYVSDDPDSPGEVLVYYQMENWESRMCDSMFVVMNRQSCLEMRNSVRESHKKIKKWCRVAKANHVDRHQKALDIDFPSVNILWTKEYKSSFGRRFYPYYYWSGEGHWLSPIAQVSDGGAGALIFKFVINDGYDGGDYPVEFFIDYGSRTDLLEHLDYDALKKRFFELHPDRSHYDELFK